MVRLDSRRYVILCPRGLTWFLYPELELLLLLVAWELVLPTIGETDVSTGGLTRSSSMLKLSIDSFASKL